MKNKPLSKSIIEIIISASPWLMIIAAVLFAIFLSSCATSEELTTINTNDRIIIGVTNNGKKYKVVNQFGHREPNVKSDTIDYTKVGERLICHFRF